MHCRTYSTAVHVIEESQIVLKQHVQTGFRGQSRDEGVRAKLSLWPQSVPGWQPSCERLPPASWAVVGLGVGMMDLCCAVVCCVEYNYSGPSNNSAAVFASRKKIRKNMSATDTTLSILPISGASIICQAIPKAL